MLVNIIIALGITSLTVVAVNLISKWRTPNYSPEAQIFIDARNLIERVGFCQREFTPIGLHGIGSDYPHCILAAVTASDPAYVRHGSLYDLPSIEFLRQFSLDHLGMYPEDVNDRLGQEAVQELLLDAADAR